MGRFYRGVKRGLDLAVAGGVLVATAPLLGAAALGVRATLGAPVLFRQRRPGLHGHPFQMIKLRTMKVAKPGQGVESDAARLTRFGDFLRRSSIDELPALWNVLRGEMSVVGPRPLLMEYLDRYTPEQAKRHNVKPGITGWAQINGRNNLDWEVKLAYDTWYADTSSFTLDLKILWRTLFKVLARTDITGPGSVTAPVFQRSRPSQPSPSKEPVEPAA